MNRREFQGKIFAHYPTHFNKENNGRSVAWIEAFNNAFPGNGYDYDKLYLCFCNFYESSMVPPMPAFFKKFQESCRLKNPSADAPPKMSPQEKEQGDKKAKEFFAKVKARFVASPWGQL